MNSKDRNNPVQLKRQIGVFQATLLGLGSILGTGVFVSIGIASGVTGAAVVLAIPIAAFVALCNGMSSAQLAANLPVSGGTYEYGYNWLRPSLGFTAGWLFLCAKSASAATAALGFAAYLKSFLGAGDAIPASAIAVGIVVVMTVLALLGIRRSIHVNTTIVAVTVSSLVWFVLSGLGDVSNENLAVAFELKTIASPNFLESIALMFVAYTGYGRIATLGEEIHKPRKNIPVAILSTLAITVFLYLTVAVVAVGAVGSDSVAAATETMGAPLQYVSKTLDFAGGSFVIQIGAMTAMLGVLLNLILGLSRVLLAMGRRGDMPKAVAKIDSSGETPYVAVVVVCVLIVSITAIGSLKVAWSFSAFTVLIYYSLTNLCALQLSAEERLYPKFIPVAGLCSCLFLAFWVEPIIWGAGLGVIAIGLVWHAVAQRLCAE